MIAVKPFFKWLIISGLLTTALNQAVKPIIANKNPIASQIKTNKVGSFLTDFNACGLDAV